MASKKQKGDVPLEEQKAGDTTQQDAVAAEATAEASTAAEPAAEGEVVTEPTAEELLEAEHDKFLRLAAEYDNFRKRTTKERAELGVMVKADTVTRLLPVYDNLLRALETPCADEGFYKGIELTKTQFMEILEGLGVAEIVAVGEKFDPERHNAVSQASEEGVESGTIVMEFQKGFTLDGKVIRHSIVQVNG